MSAVMQNHTSKKTSHITACAWIAMSWQFIGSFNMIIMVFLSDLSAGFGWSTQFRTFLFCMWCMIVSLSDIIISSSSSTQYSINLSFASAEGMVCLLNAFTIKSDINSYITFTLTSINKHSGFG